MDEPTLKTVEPACPKACAHCPWRIANQGSKPDPHKFFTSANLARLWKGLRKGARMSCHPTDPRMAEFKGYEALADRDVTHECAGSLIIVQREMMVFQAVCEEDPASKKSLSIYRKRRPNGLMREGMVALVERTMFGGTRLNPIKMATPDLNDPEVGYDAIEKGPRVKT